MNQDQLNFDFSLKALFFFNPLAIPTVPKPSEQDQQDAKLIYYYPQNANIEEKRIQTGMAEGIFQFFTQFNPNPNILEQQENKNKNESLQFQTIHLEQQTHIICRVKEDLFLFMTLAHQKISKIKTIVEDYFFSECNKFHFSLSKNLYTNIAENFVINFELFYGQDLTQLDQYTQRWILCNARSGAILNLFNFQSFSLKYAKIDAAIYMHLQSILTLGRQQEEQITDFIVFYAGYFLFSTLPHQKAILFKEHYYGSGLPWSNFEGKINQKFPPYTDNQSAYLNFFNLRNIVREGFSGQMVYINKQKKNIFTFLEKQLFIIVIANPLKDLQNLQKLVNVFQKSIDKLIYKLDIIIEQNQRQDLVKFIYFNGVNLAYRVSSQLIVAKLSSENLRVLQLVYEKLNTSNQYVIRTAGVWFYGSKVTERKVVYILPANIPLSKVEEEVNKIADQTFPNLLL
ncbi:unnamed protein product [Paramecium pentaurelia]|uniref:CCZ1/INTU/HSP4 first Longin domain-containing protein n=1 Tax=Paramecium pentaurelia TaxID=43138 RepID=A0A8S1W6K3_9CILI|nr:unnamed protein product [Paramecium pentaurelia]